MTARDGWMPGTFCILKGTIAEDGTETPTRMEPVEGETWGPFGLHKDRNGWLWAVTHLATGRDAGMFERKTQAKAYCRAIAGLTDWSASVDAPLSGALLASVRDAFDRYDGVRLIRFG